MPIKYQLFDQLNAQIVSELHDRRLLDRNWAASQTNQLLSLIQKNHFFNTSLWEEEDLARRINVPDGEIATNKRNIDAFNQKRNDMIELIDQEILNELGSAINDRALLHSETAGAIVDRLSILSLKIHHMRIQTERGDVDHEHLKKCANKLEILKIQRGDLASCFDRLITNCREGRVFFKIYRQYKMYNDPTLNPWLYLKGGKSGNSTPSL